MHWQAEKNLTLSTEKSKTENNVITDKQLIMRLFYHNFVVIIKIVIIQEYFLGKNH